MVVLNSAHHLYIDMFTICLVFCYPITALRLSPARRCFYAVSIRLEHMHVARLCVMVFITPHTICVPHYAILIGLKNICSNQNDVMGRIFMTLENLAFTYIRCWIMMEHCRIDTRFAQYIYSNSSNVVDHALFMCAPDDCANDVRSEPFGATRMLSARIIVLANRNKSCNCSYEMRCGPATS